MKFDVVDGTLMAVPARRTKIRPNLGVWSEAMRLCDGDISRLEVVREDLVRVHNTGVWREAS